MHGDNEIALAVGEAAERRKPIRIVGAGNWLDAGNAGNAGNAGDTTGTAATRLSLAEDVGVVAYTPGDLTITARAGTRLGDLADVLAENDQWLGMDPEQGAQGSIGATVATGSYGPAAALFGTPRDQVLGMTVVTGTGAIIHVGGRVVKNVAGFDLTRLMVGAWGTLGVITEVTLRVRSRALNPGSVSHMRRTQPHRYGYRTPVITQPALFAALKQRFDPCDILNRGIMVAANG